MAVEKAIHAGHLAAIAVAIHSVPIGAIPVHAVSTLVKTLFLLHESVWILAQILGQAAVPCQEFLQCGMAVDELLVVDKRRILSQLFCDFRMLVEEIVEISQLLPRFARVEPLFPVHERVWIFLKLLACSRILPKKLLQLGMACYEVFVLHQGWIFAQLLGDLRVSIHEAVKAT